MSGLELMIYDRTCRGRGPLPGLSHAWGLGAALYRGLGRLDATRGVSSWSEAFEWLGTVREGEPISGVQFWGHGKWGDARIGAEVLDESTLLAPDPSRGALDRVRGRLTPSSLFWFRTCETFGAARGHAFARAFSDFIGCRAAGHTYVIGDWQSGLHSLEPGAAPGWSPEEGLLEGSPRAPKRARWSTPVEPNTIHCLRGAVPEGF